MKLKITLLALLGWHFAGAQGTCATATPITPGTYNAVFTAGSQVPSLICTGEINNPTTLGIWFSFTPTATITATVNTNVSGYPNRDTRVHVYSGNCETLICVAGNDDAGNGQLTSLANFTATAGVTYYIAFDNNWDSNSFHFTLSESVPSSTSFSQQSISMTGTQYCIVDLNGDYLDDIVAPVNNGVNVLYQSANGSGFTQASLTAPSTVYMPSWSMAAGDFDKNGFNDLLYGSGSGATVMLANATGTAFETAFISTQYLFSQRTNFVDINNDGNLDAFVCHDVQPNCYFLNDGAGGFTFHQGGLGDFASGGNYGSIWIDYDNDGDSDLFIAKCRGGSDAAIDELHRNNGDGTFTNVAQQAGFADLHQSWSSAWGDFDNDGDMDVLVGGSSSPHKLMRNNGNGTFTNVTVGSGFESYTTNIEHTAHDFDNDGYVDIFGGGNIIMHNNGDMTFSPISVSASNGPIGDLNNDGFLDIQNGNTLHINNGNDNHYLKVHLQGVESNRNGIGARVVIYANGAPWSQQIRDVKSGDGFRYMSSLNTHFGLGSVTELVKLVVIWPSGTIDMIDYPTIDSAILVVEGSTLSVQDNVNKMFTLYPNPAKEVLNIQGSASFEPVRATIYNLEGKLVKKQDIKNTSIPVQQLAKGTYIINLQDKEGKNYSAKFIKE
ncbi:T9SS type A sorting domain-containing protein [Flavobacterium sp. Sd200]|uniref:FG-GAP-like repeat-containing protein n=1 Tax=Flavobacterium sp. Sd200 TaxID=2692211 RepID=UPI00136F6584|nr:FG-GAP-like repeat-containing protein [Flavobacterium sp. Sd200]MXN92444.1 T9SS type A sorting domain-containing protein [Flavobacterium sp. Sd200]